MTALVLRALHWNRALSMDLTVMREVALLRSHNLSRAILWMTHAGDGGWLTVLSLAAGLAMVLRGRLAWAFYLWGTSVGAALSSSMVKHLVMRHRPNAALHHALAMATSWSLPSGHAMQSAAVYSALAVLAFEAGLRWKWQVALALATLTAVVAFSRVYLGVHYPTDVFIGCGLGLAWPLGLRSLMVGQSELVRAPIAAEATGERLTP
ncbi:MAG TPA: phosphatase PAP2 family protein [Polyangiaceae bacterium]